VLYRAECNSTYSQERGTRLNIFLWYLIL
jgi:hypothetical protein